MSWQLLADNMTEQKLYDQVISILDNFQEESLKELDQLSVQVDWKKRIVHGLFRQAANLMHCLLANSEKSKFLSSVYVTDLILVGTLGRLFRDIYLNIVYLKTTKLSDQQMKACWEYQIVSQQINTINYANIDKNVDVSQFEIKREALKLVIDTIPFSDKQHKDSVYSGRNEMALSLSEIALIKGFNRWHFKREFVFFSQFAHSSAFANKFITDEGIPREIQVAVYDKLTPYFVGLVVESIELLSPNHIQLKELISHYDQLISKSWNRGEVS